MDADDATAVVQVIDSRIAHHLQQLGETLMPQIMQEVHVELEAMRGDFAATIAQLGSNDEALHQILMTRVFPDSVSQIAHDAWARFIASEASNVIRAWDAEPMTLPAEAPPEPWGPMGPDSPGYDYPSVGTTEPPTPVQPVSSEALSAPNALIPPPPPPAPPAPSTADLMAAASAANPPGTPHLAPRQ